MNLPDEKLWFKNPAIVIPAVIAILAAIIGVTLDIWLRPSPSDFEISVVPVDGQIQPNSVTQTTATVTGINGYKHPVTLKSEQPSGFVVSFIPSGEAAPSYTSNILINIDPNVQAGTYTIKIKGTGADGKEHGTQYSLNVLPLPPTSTPTPTPTPTPSPTSTPIPTVTPTITPTPTPPTPTPTATPSPTLTPTPTTPIPVFEIEIIDPQNNDTVKGFSIVRGTIKGEIPEKQYLWVVSDIESVPGLWWPQAGPVKPQYGLWNANVWLGSDNNSGKVFSIAAIVVNENDNQIFMNYREEGNKTGSFPAIKLPDSATIMDSIKVTRIKDINS